MLLRRELALKNKSEHKAKDHKLGEIYYQAILRKQRTARVLHAINNQLSVILGNLELIAHKSDVDKDGLADCLQATQEAMTLVTNIFKDLVSAGKPGKTAARL